MINQFGFQLGPFGFQNPCRRSLTTFSGVELPFFAHLASPSFPLAMAYFPLNPPALKLLFGQLRSWTSPAIYADKFSKDASAPPYLLFAYLALPRDWHVCTAAPPLESPACAPLPGPPNASEFPFEVDLYLHWWTLHLRFEHPLLGWSSF